MVSLTTIIFFPTVKAADIAAGNNDGKGAYRNEGRREFLACGKADARGSFDEPQRAIAPGQTAVLYDGDIVLGAEETPRNFV